MMYDIPEAAFRLLTSGLPVRTHKREERERRPGERLTFKESARIVSEIRRLRAQKLAPLAIARRLRVSLRCVEYHMEHRS